MGSGNGVSGSGSSVSSHADAEDLCITQGVWAAVSTYNYTKQQQANSNLVKKTVRGLSQAS